MTDAEFAQRETRAKRQLETDVAPMRNMLSAARAAEKK